MIISSFLLLGGMGIFVYRYLVYNRLNQIKDAENYDPTFQRKLTYVKQKETEKHVFYLLILAFLLLISLFVGTISTYQLTKASDASQKEIQQLQEEVTRINETQQIGLNQQDSRGINEVQQSEELPDVDLNLTSYKWKEVFENKNQSEKNRIETDLSKELKTYFKVDTVNVTLVNNKTMNLFLIGESKATDESEQLLDKVSEFVEKANEVPELNQIRFESDKALKNDDTSILYSRKTNQENFKEQSNNTSKMKEGKG